MFSEPYDILVPLDMHRNEIRNFKIENLVIQPSSPDLYKNRVWIYDGFIHYYDGERINQVAIGSDLTTAALMPDSAFHIGQLMVSGGLDRSLVPYSGGEGLLMVDSASIVMKAQPGVNYLSPDGVETIKNKKVGENFHNLK